ncbi:MAG: hemolysin III family protein [Acidobacteria bacterium]|nr:hemolysin III family protein [Acidobacteriota bacterium]
MFASGERTQSRGEEIANSVSHGVGLLAVVVAAPVLIGDAVQRGGATRLIGASVFVSAVGLVYLTSVLYHALPPNRAKRLFQVLDHGAIFLLIAGTYTPFTLGVLHGAWGFGLLGLVWSLALVGVVLKATSGAGYPRFSLGLYLAMGWAVLIAIKPLRLLMPAEGIFWLLSGGIAYTAGVAFFAAKRVRYSHFVWHLFVLVGTACHFIAVLRYAA